MSGDFDELRDEATERAAVVTEARSWIGTPFVWASRVKGPKGGADCGTFLAGVYENAGIFKTDPAEFLLQQEDLEPGTPQKVGDRISAQWHRHGSKELYLMRVVRHAAEITLTHMREIGKDVLEGDMALTMLNGRLAHAAIVIGWPKIIHCFGSGVHKVDANTDPMWRGQVYRFFSPWGNS